MSFYTLAAVALKREAFMLFYSVLIINDAWMIVDVYCFYLFALFLVTLILEQTNLHLFFL